MFNKNTTELIKILFQITVESLELKCALILVRTTGDIEKYVEIDHLKAKHKHIKFVLPKSYQVGEVYHRLPHITYSN